MAPRKQATPVNADPLDDAISTDAKQDANELSDVLDSIRSLTGSGIKVNIYRINQLTQSWEYCFAIAPPFDTNELMVKIREDWGPANYALRVQDDNGKILKTRKFAIAGDKKTTAALSPNGGGLGGSADTLRMFMEMNNAARADNNNMMMMLMQQQQAAAQMQMQMMQQSSQQMMTMITAIIGQPKDTPASMIAALAGAKEMFSPPEGGLEKTLATIKAVKEIMPGGDGGDDSLLGVAKAVIPSVLGAVGNLTAGAGAQGVQARPALISPQTAPAIAGPQAPPPAQVEGQPDTLLAMIGPDILFLAERGYDPDSAADILAERLDKLGKGYSDVVATVAAYAPHGERWLDALAADGLDLRQYAQWFVDVLQSLQSAYADDGGADDPGTGEVGGGSDTGDNAEAGETGGG